MEGEGEGEERGRGGGGKGRGREGEGDMAKRLSMVTSGHIPEFPLPVHLKSEQTPALDSSSYWTHSWSQPRG